MEKDIKNYLHLYLGQDVKLNEQHTEAPRVVLSGMYYAQGQTGYWPDAARCQLFTHPGENILWLRLDEFKLILRPLSDMTEDEEAYMVGTQDKVKLEGYPEIGLLADSGETFRYLLSKSFDLFGLIEAGLAIDKTKK